MATVITHPTITTLTDEPRVLARQQKVLLDAFARVLMVYPYSVSETEPMIRGKVGATSYTIFISHMSNQAGVYANIIDSVTQNLEDVQGVLSTVRRYLAFERERGYSANSISYSAGTSETQLVLDASITSDFVAESQSDIGFENAIKSALLNGDLGRAREFAMRGHLEFPDNDHLAQAAIVLAPPKIVSRNVPPKPGLYEAIDWLEKHREDYKGLWVALHNGNFVAAATSRMELIDKINEVSPISDIVITFVE